MDRATVIMLQAKQVPDELLLEMIDNASDKLELAILNAELNARTAPRFRGLSDIIAGRTPWSV